MKLLDSFIKTFVTGDKSNSLIRDAYHVGVKGTLWSAPFVALDIATAPRGYRLADGISKGIGEFAISPVFTTVAYIGLACMFPVIGTGLFALAASALIAAPAAMFVEDRLNRGFRAFRDLDKRQRTLQLGFQDSARSQTYRQNAIQEMSGAFSSSRRYLGNEARFMHR